MHTFIPHKNNPHTGRKILGAGTVLLLSATMAYVVQTNIAKSQNKISLADATSSEELAKSGNIVPVQDEEKLAAVIIEENRQGAIPIADSPQLGTTIEEAKADVPEAPRSKDPKSALVEAKKFAKAQITEGKYIDISLAHQNMVLFENGQYVDAYLISSGKRGMDTPVGTYQIQNKVPRAYSKSYGLYMPNWMALVGSGKFGIHELPEWPGGYKEGANHLGIPVSHGCVRLGVGPAKRVYDWADVGTTVIIHK